MSVLMSCHAPRQMSRLGPQISTRILSSRRPVVPFTLRYRFGNTKCLTNSLFAPYATSVVTPPRGKPMIFVDASGSGVGLILNEQWLAWTFTPNHPLIPVGPDNKMISSWSELIAVELGVRTLLAAGYRDTRIEIKSDDSSLVKAIKDGRWSSRHDLDVIVKRILSLSRDNGLILKVGSVKSSENPADEPSRGKYGPPELMLDYPEIPHYLVGMIQPVDLSSLPK